MVSTPSLTLAFAAGFVSFVSPCCLPLVPGYLATVGGGATSRRVLMRRSLTFVSSFSLMFILLGLSATALGSLLITNQQTLNTIAGVVIISTCLAFVGSIFILQLNRPWRVPGVHGRASACVPALSGLSFPLPFSLPSPRSRHGTRARLLLDDHPVSVISGDPPVRRQVSSYPPVAPLIVFQ